MRTTRNIAFAFAIILSGCSSYSATTVTLSDAGQTPKETGGTSNAGGDATGGSVATTSGTGGMGSNGGSAATAGAITSGGSTNTGGAATGGSTTATGGITATAGSTVTAGGAHATGGAPATGGAGNTGGTSATACTKDTDCANSDPINCSYTCSSGLCKPTATLTPTQCATSACDDKAISGFWDAAGKPHIAYSFTETDGSGTIRMQQVKLDGTVDGAVVAYKLLLGQSAPTLLSSNAIQSKIGLLYDKRVTVSSTAYDNKVEFAITDLTGAASTPTELESDSSTSSSRASMLRLDVTPVGAWLGLRIFTNPSVTYWSASTGANLAPWTSLDPLLFEGEFGASTVGNTLMLTGANCNLHYTCTAAFTLQRFSVSSLTSIGSPLTLSQHFQATNPAMGVVANQVAVLWTEAQTPGQLYRTLIKEDGTLALSIATVQSAISPKAIIGSASGGALLVGIITSGSSYQLVGQRLNSKLELVGNPIPIAAAKSEDLTGMELHASATGEQVLVTYRQAGARYRILGTDFCQGQ